MSTQLDKWLKNLDGLAGLPEDEIDARIEALKAEQESIRLKLAVLQQLRPGRIKARAGEPSRLSESAPADAQPMPPANAQKRPFDWKRRAVLDLIQSQPDRVWKAAEVRDGLIANGTMKAEEGTSTYTLLRRLADRQEIQKIGAAAYKFPAPSDDHGNAQQAFASQGATKE
jgi:ribosomal protein L29